MRVNEVMTKHVRTVDPEALLADASNLMRLTGIHHLVVAHGRQVVGVLSERDARGRRGLSATSTRRVADAMASPAVTVVPTTTVRQAANVMRGHSIGCLVVIESGRAVGIVTVSDLLELLGRGIDRGIVTTRRRTPGRRAPRRKSKGVTATSGVRPGP